MKTHPLRFIAASITTVSSCLLAPISFAQGDDPPQINWGSQDFSTIVDSNGQTLNPANFTFELGAFAEGFTPSASNVSQWYANWYTFDRANYVVDEFGTSVFASSYTMYDGTYDGTSDFSGVGISRDAYVWVYNSTTMQAGSEWFIARATTWAFPEVPGECCNNGLPIEWSMSDLAVDDTPLWGNQSGIEGLGDKTNFISGADLQTYTIPEPTAALLLAFASLAGVMRRSRPKA